MVFNSQTPSQNVYREVIQRASEYIYCAQKFTGIKLRAEQRIRWERQGRGWLKLNTDGSFLGNPGAAGREDIVRDASGSWIQAFSKKIGITSSFLAELWALRDELFMCLNLGVNALEVELDAKVVSDLMNHYRHRNAVNSSLVADYRHLISQIPQVKVSHCYREANYCADGLARLGAQQFDDVVFYNSPPLPLLDFFLLDLYGHYCTRLCLD